MMEKLECYTKKIGPIVFTICSAWLLLGWLLFLFGFFVLPKLSALKIAFYLFLQLPFLFMLPFWLQHVWQYSSPLLITSFIFLLYMAFTCLWASVPWIPWFPFFLKQVVFVMSWLVATVWVSLNFPRLYFVVLQGLLMVVCVVAILTVGQYLWAAFNSHNLPRMEGYGILYNSLVAAQAFGSLAVASLVLAVTVHRKKVAFFYGGLFIVFAVAVALTQSRGPIISLFAVALLIVLLSPYSVRHRLKIVFLVSASVVLMLALYPEMIDLLQREDNPFSYRLQIWDYILEHAQQNIIFGQGITRETEFPIGNVVFEHSHNVIIDTLRFGGLVGVALLFWNIKTAFKGWTANKEHYPYYAWLLFGLLCMLTNGKFLLARPDWIWICYWLPLGFICAVQNRSAKHEKP